MGNGCLGVDYFIFYLLWYLSKFPEFLKINLKDPAEKNRNPVHFDHIASSLLLYLPPQQPPSYFHAASHPYQTQRPALGSKFSPHRPLTPMRLWDRLKGTRTSSGTKEDSQLGNQPWEPESVLQYSGSHTGHPSPAVREEGVYHESKGSPILQPTLGAERSLLSLSVMVLTF